MQQQLQTEFPDLKIQILGINERGQEIGNSSVTRGRAIPWLQDVDANQDGRSDVWDQWHVTWRDVVILNGENEIVGVYNLTRHDLAEQDHFDTLKGMLIEAARAEATAVNPWQNPVQPLDVNNDTFVTAIDALLVINRLNRLGSGQLPKPTDTDRPPPYYDSSGDGMVSPIDALLVINELNRQVDQAARARAASPLEAMPSRPASATVPLTNRSTLPGTASPVRTRAVDETLSSWPAWSRTVVTAKGRLPGLSAPRWLVPVSEVGATQSPDKERGHAPAVAGPGDRDMPGSDTAAALTAQAIQVADDLDPDATAGR